MLTFRLDNETVVVNGEDSHFKDTQWEAPGWEITIKPLDTITQQNAKISSINKKGILNEASALRKLFNECVVDWKGVGNFKSKEIKCNQQNKEKIVANSPDFASIVVAIARDYALPTTTNEEILDTEVKN